MPSANSLQETIDVLFERLENTSDPGQVSQVSHALRMHIGNKVKKGLLLSPRERSLLSALGPVVSRSKQRSVPWLFIGLLLAGLAALWWWWQS